MIVLHYERHSFAFYVESHRLDLLSLVFTSYLNSNVQRINYAETPKVIVDTSAQTTTYSYTAEYDCFASISVYHASNNGQGYDFRLNNNRIAYSRGAENGSRINVSFPLKKGSIIKIVPSSTETYYVIINALLAG